MTTSPTATAPVPPPPPATDAQAYLAHPRFHQTFTLPATASHGALVFSYAEAGREGTRRGRGRERERRGENDDESVRDVDDDEEEEEEDIPTVLLIPGMFASRYMATWPAVHAVAAGMGVRVLAVDRPGLGRSTAVPLAQRVPVWLELVPALLRHLGIRHVALVSHSAGTIYALNTLSRCRDVLHPERPLVALLGPFVDTAASRKRDVQLLQWIPAPAFAVWNRIPQFVQTTAQGPLALSGAALESLRTLVPSRSRHDDEASMAPGRARAHRHAQRLAGVYGVPDDADAAAALATATGRALFAEDTRGANDEARLCLKKGPPGLWGACDDYAAFVRALAAQERERRRDRQGAPPPPKLRVRVFFAASDAMSGASGQAYMEACWQDARPGGALADVLQVDTATVADTDHDEVADDLATLESIFAAAGGVRPDAEVGTRAEANVIAGAQSDTAAPLAGNES